MLRGQLNALDAGRGSVMLVTGPAGVGKTTLLAEAANLAMEGEIRAFCGGGDPAARVVPFGAILDALVSTDDPPVDPARLRELSQSPDQRFWLVRELQESLEKAAHRAPLLIVVDDLHWADAASASAVGHAVQATGYAPDRLAAGAAPRGAGGRCAGGGRQAGGGGRVRGPARPPGRDRGDSGRP